MAFQGTETAEYHAPEPGRIYGRGAVCAGDYWPDFADNIFHTILLNNAVGLPNYIDPDGNLSRTVAAAIEWHVEQGPRVCGQPCVVLRGHQRVGDEVATYAVTATASPLSCIVGIKSRLVRGKAIIPYDDLEIRSLGTVGGLVYPASGRYVLHALRANSRIEYEFTVLSARRLDESARKSWRPAWPEGTDVVDQVKGQTYTTPLSPEKYAKRSLAAARHAMQGRRGQPSSRTPAFLFNVAMLVVLTVTLIVYRYKRYRSQSALGVQ